MNYKQAKIKLIHSSEGNEYQKFPVQIFIINFNLAEKTIECLKKLSLQNHQNFWVHLLDNDSQSADREVLLNFVVNYNRICYYEADCNSGFAVGHNLLFDETFAKLNGDQIIVLLNNDAFPNSDFIEKIVAPISVENHVEMVASRMMRFDQSNEIDNLGNVYYKSGLTSNRLSTNATLMCPCAGAGAYSVRMMKHIKDAHGEIFDEDFFCYVEDSDLGWRASALGYKCAFANDAVTYHLGSASSGGRFSKFVMVHGLRNSLFFLIKSVPAKILIKNIFWIFFLQSAICFRYMMMGCFKELWLIYSDFFKNLRRFMGKRKKILKSYPTTNLNHLISNQFYDKNYIRNVLRSAWWFPKFLIPKNNVQK